MQKAQPLLIWILISASSLIQAGELKKDFGIKFMSDNDFGDTIGADFDVGYEITTANSKPWTLGEINGWAGVHTKGTLAIDEDRNPKPLEAGLSLGIKSILNYLGDDPDEGPDIDLGAIRFSGNAKFETDQPFKNRNFLLGGALYWEPPLPATNSAWLAAVPTVLLEHSWVDPLAVDTPGGIVHNLDAYTRTMGEVFWTIPFGDWCGWHPLNPFELSLDLRTYLLHGEDAVLEQFDLEESHYASVTLAYKKELPIWKKIKVHGWYISYSDGRIPPIKEESQSIFIGLDLLGSK